MCQRAGGSVRISSTVGNGTVIRLFLPASTPVQAAGQAPTVAALGGLNKSLLLVEDNDEVAGSLVQVLESLGCRVKRVDGAAKARDLLDDGARPDLVLSDVVMPGAMDGVGLAQHIRESWPEQRLVLMTGYAEQLDRIKAMGFEVLPKPCTPEMLQAAVARFAR
jgi:CheY-like chemotaxis protein